MTSEWTIDTLREHLSAVLAERDRAIDKLAAETIQRFRDADYATTAKFATTNEWRQTYGDIANTMMPRSEAEEKNKSLQAQVTAIQQAPFVSRPSLDLVETSFQREVITLRDRLTVLEADHRSTRDAFAEFKANADQRFNQVNEFRAAMGDQQKTFLPKAVWDSGHEMLRSTVEAQQLALVHHAGDDQRWQGELRNSIQSLHSRMIGATAAVAAIMAVVVALVAILRINA